MPRLRRQVIYPDSNYCQGEAAEEESSDDADKREEGSYISLLGTDQVLAILEFLPVPSVVAFGMTCRKFMDIASSDSLWSLICRREWGSYVVETWPLLGNNSKLGWKDLYRKMLALGSVTWHKLYQGDTFPSARASHSFITVGKNLILFGGGHEGGRHLDDTWASPLPGNMTDTIEWHQITMGIPGGRFGQSCAIVEGTLVLFGGINDHGMRQRDTWINKIVDGTVSFWQLLDVAAAPPERGAHAGCYAGDSKVVIFGGIGSDGIRLNDTWILDISEEPLPAWRKVETVVSPPARSGHSLNYLGGHCMILFGGRGTRFEVLNDVWLLDMEGEPAQWVELRASELHPKHQIPSPCAGHSATLIFGGRILIYGGEDAKRSRKGDVWVLDPGIGVPVGNYRPCIGLPDMKSQKGFNKQDRKFWKKLKQWGQPPSTRSFHSATSACNGYAILIFGGMVDGEVTPSSSAGLAFDDGLHWLQLTP